MKFVFWQGVFSMHQSAYLRALSERGHDCTCVVDALIDGMPERVEMGWQNPDPGQVRVVVNPQRKTVLAILDQAREETIHILGGIRSSRVVEWAWRDCRRHSRRFGILSERVNTRGWRGLLRRVFYGWAGRRHGTKPDFVLALGELGVRWCAECKFPCERLFPVAYVTETPAFDVPLEPRTDPRFQILQLGCLIPRKAPDLLLSALARLSSDAWRLQLVGDGPLRAGLERFVRRQGWNDRVDFLGSLPHEQAMRVLAGVDLLVLPSRFDGWGAVVNEALMRGVPVVCSDQCGARDLLREPWRGEFYPYRDIGALAQSLQSRLDAGPPSAAARRRLRAWSRCIQGDALADYFLAVMEHVYAKGPRPTPPWSCAAPPRRERGRGFSPALADAWTTD